MKTGKILSVVLSAVIIASALAGTLNIFAKTADRNSERNPAWLADFYVRESSTDLTRKELVPRTDGIYSRSLGGFKAEVTALKKASSVNLDNLTKRFDDVVDKLYNMISETGLLEEYESMKEYLITEYGIVYPETADSSTPAYTAVVYACLKYDIISPITGKPVVIPEGTTIDRAISVIVANVLGEELSDSVTSIEDYAIENMKQLLRNNGYEVTSDYTPEQVILQYKLMIAEQQGYTVKNKNIKGYTQEDIKNLDGAYYAAVIKKNYNVSPTPEDAYTVMTSEDSDAAAALILGLMIESKGESTAKDNTLEALFSHACKLGFFNIDNGFYSDVYNYDVYLKYNCTGVWLTAYAYAPQLGEGEVNNVKLTINGAAVTNGKSYLLKLTGDVTKVVVASVYNNGKQQENAVYTFMIHNGKEKIPETANPAPASKKSDMPSFVLPDVDSNGEYAPIPEEIIFNPYDTSGQTMSGSSDVDAVDVKAPRASDSKAKTENNTAGAAVIDFKSGLIIAGCAAGGVIAGSAAIIGALAVIKKKRGHIL